MQSAVLAYLHLRPLKASNSARFGNFKYCPLNGVGHCVTIMKIMFP